MYVDNLITGAISVTEAISIYSDPKKIFREASMNLREWISNDKVVDTFIPESDTEGVCSTNVFGHVWNVNTDTLSLESTLLCVIGGNQTKRTTLKKVAEVIDPLGFFSPVNIQGKIPLITISKIYGRKDLIGTMN